MSSAKLISFTTGIASTELTPSVDIIRVSNFWNKGNKGQGRVVAVLDTGCSNHPDLAGAIIGGYNFTTEGAPTDYTDLHGHGTHVAGTIAARSNGQGVIGVAPETRLLVLKVLDMHGEGDLGDVAKALNYVADWRGPNDEKVDVVSMSLGGPLSLPALQTAVHQVTGLGIPIVCAAGNAGDGDAATQENAFPGSYPEVITVGACDQFGHVAKFSNSNPEIDVVAPGVDIASTYLNGQYVSMSGTSMATPHVSGAVVLIINEFITTNGRRPTEAEIYGELITRATSLGYPKTEQGYGMIFYDYLAKQPYTNFLDIPVEVAIEAFRRRFVIEEPDKWLANAQQGKLVPGIDVACFLKKAYARLIQ